MYESLSSVNSMWSSSARLMRNAGAHMEISDSWLWIEDTCETEGIMQLCFVSSGLFYECFFGVTFGSHMFSLRALQDPGENRTTNHNNTERRRMTSFCRPSTRARVIETDTKHDFLTRVTQIILNIEIKQKSGLWFTCVALSSSIIIIDDYYIMVPTVH